MSIFLPFWCFCWIVVGVGAEEGEGLNCSSILLFTFSCAKFSDSMKKSKSLCKLNRQYMVQYSVVFNGWQLLLWFTQHFTFLKTRDTCLSDPPHLWLRGSREIMTVYILGDCKMRYKCCEAALPVQPLCLVYTAHSFPVCSTNCYWE